MNYTNTCDFDYTENYQALLACIFNPELTIEKALGIVAQISNKSASATKLSKRKISYDCKVKLIDEIKNKEYQFDSVEECCKFLGIKTKTVNTYIKYRRRFKGRYRILADGDFVSSTNKARPVRVTDTLTNEVLEFNSMSKSGKFLKTDNKSIGTYIENKRLYKNRYKIEYKVGDDIHE